MNDIYKHVLFQHAATIKEACAPLSLLSIDGFIFMRRFSDGKFVDLSNQIPWSESFLNRYMEGKIHFQNARDHMLITTGVSLWSHNLQNSIWQEGRKVWGFHSGISIAKEGPYWTDIYCYYSRKTPDVMDRQYLYNFHLLEKFNNLFCEKFHQIIKIGEREPLVTPSVYMKAEGDDTPKIPDELRGPNLTSRERECVFYLKKGKRVAEVAKIMHISKRTVESHLRNAKKKCSVEKSLDLFKLYPEW